MNTLLLTHPVCLQHDTGELHPECADRLKAIMHVLEHEEFCYLARDEAPLVTMEQLTRAHPQRYIDHILSVVPKPGEEYQVDDDTFMSAMSGEAALRAAGAVCAAVDEVSAGRAVNAFCAVRPPGHHAEREAAMGFCLFAMPRSAPSMPATPMDSSVSRWWISMFITATARSRSSRPSRGPFMRRPISGTPSLYRFGRRTGAARRCRRCECALAGGQRLGRLSRRL